MNTEPEIKKFEEGVIPMKSFNFEFEQERPNHITFDYSPEADEELDTLVENGLPILYANRPALLSLARLFLKMALGEYKEGFHVHLRKISMLINRTD